MRNVRASAGRPSLRRIGARRRSGRFGLALLVASAFALLLTPPSFAATVYQPQSELGPTPTTSFNNLRANSSAANNFNGHVLVADSGNGRIYDFASPSDTAPVVRTGSNTPNGSFGGGRVAVAVDNTTGDYYVASSDQELIDKFDASGNLIASFGDTSPSHDGQLRGLATPAGSFAPASASQTPFAIAVNQATRDLYVVDAGHQVIDVFDSSGAYLKQITATPTGLYGGGGAYVNSIAVNATNGNVYVLDWRTSSLVFQFDAGGNYVSTWDGGNLPNGAASETPDGNFSPNCEVCYLSAVASEDSTGKVFVVSQSHAALDVFDANGNFLPPQATSEELQAPGFSWLAEPQGVSVDQASGKVYVSTRTRVQIFKAVVIPDLTLDSVSGVTAHGAHLSGHVDLAGGGNVTECRFEVIDAYSYNKNPTNNPWSGAQQLPCDAEPPGSLPYTGPTDVVGTATGLVRGVEYRVRLVASNSEGGAKTATRAFSTAGDFAYSTVFGASGSGAGQLDEPKDVAVDSVTGDVYVADTGNHRVVKFDSSGQFVATWGWGVGNGSAESQVCSSSCQAGIAGSGPGQFQSPRYIEVDNSPGPSAHDVYVGDTANAEVQKFTSSGGLLSGWGVGGAIDFSPRGTIAGMTVADSGDLFVVTTNTPYIWAQIGQDGFSQTLHEPSGLGSPNGGGIEVDAFGEFYETQPGGPNVDVGVRRPGFWAFYPEYRGLVNSGLTIDRDSGDLYVDQGDHIDLFEATGGCPLPGFGPSSNCGPQNTFGFGNLVAGSGLAFNPGSQRLYAADAGADRVVVFARRPAPQAQTGPAEGVGLSEATLTGHLTPAPSETITDCHFEYGIDQSYDLGSVPCAPATPLASSTDVTADVLGLTAFTTYHYRLAVEGESEIPRYGLDLTFTATTGTPPTVSAAAASAIGLTTATLNAQVNPEMAPTSYRFEFGTTTDYGSLTAMSEPFGGDNSSHLVSQAVAGLQPGTTYHYRALATSFNGTSAGPDQTFTTPNVPVIVATSAAGVGQTTATIEAQIRPGSSPTVFRVQYGPTAEYGGLVVGDVGGDNDLHSVRGQVTGLEPGRTYHYRVTAANAFGTSAGPDGTFTTAPATTEPGKRPPCKAGFVRKHGKCVKRHHRKRKQGKRGHAKHPHRSGGRASGHV